MSTMINHEHIVWSACALKAAEMHCRETDTDGFFFFLIFAVFRNNFHLRQFIWDYLKCLQASAFSVTVVRGYWKTNVGTLVYTRNGGETCFVEKDGKRFDIKFLHGV